MKSIFAILAMMVGVSCFAEVFTWEKADELKREYQKTKSAAAKAALDKYFAETEFNKGQSESYNLGKLSKNVGDTYKGDMNSAAILDYADRLYKTTDKNVRKSVVIRTFIKNRAYDALKAEVGDGKDIPDANWACTCLCAWALERRNYDEAIKYGNMVNPLGVWTAKQLQRAYASKGQTDKAFEVGVRLFLETYVTSPREAMDIMTNMMNRVPDSYDDAKLAELLAKIGKKYPAPGADFEAWKSFMGFIGYRYKALTGKDLFANSDK